MTESHQDRAAGNGGVGTADVTFAGILGDRWQTSGDGIYRLADDADLESPDDVDAHLARSQSSPVRRPARRWLRRSRR